VTTLPRPMAADATVAVDAASRELVVKPAPEAPGYARLLWRRGHRALLDDEGREPWHSKVPRVWASAPGGYQIAVGSPGEDGTLRFRFRTGDPRYRELVSTPGLRRWLPSTVRRVTFSASGSCTNGRADSSCRYQAFAKIF
jgi:hypothetical protein